MQLIDNWQTAYRYYSVQLSFVIAVLALAQATILPLLGAQMTPTQYAMANGVLAFVLGLLRLVKQGPVVDEQ